MRTIAYITRAGCPSCKRMLEEVMAPLAEAHPGRVTVHPTWDRTVQRVNARKPITRIPLIVVENGGAEEFRYSGWLGRDELEEVLTSDAPALTLEDLL